MQNIDELLTREECNFVEKVALRHTYIQWNDPLAKRPLELGIIKRKNKSIKLVMSPKVKINISVYV